MVVAELVIAAAGRVVGRHLGEKLLVDQRLSLFEVKRVGATVADVFAFVPKKVEHGLEHTRVLYKRKLPQV